MYGQRQIFTCLAIVALCTVLNFYRSAMRHDREHRRWAAERLTERAAREQRAERSAEWRRHWRLEYADRCWDVHALAFRPIADDDGGTTTANGTSEAAATAVEVRSESVVAAAACQPTTTSETPPAGPMRRVASSATTAANTDTAATASGGIVYVVVFILLVMLAKALYDLSKQFREVRENRTLTEDEMLRRCSLQEYSLIKHNQKKQQQQQQKSLAAQNGDNSAGKAAAVLPGLGTQLRATHSAALEPFFKRCAGVGAGPLRAQMSLDSGADELHRDLVRRMSGSSNPQDYRDGSGMPTEPGTPVKAGKLLAGRPAPMLRRCSVPAFMNAAGDVGRRPSMDGGVGGQLDESSTETQQRRRVRMIHRH